MNTVCTHPFAMRIRFAPPGCDAINSVMSYTPSWSHDRKQRGPRRRKSQTFVHGKGEKACLVSEDLISQCMKLTFTGMVAAAVRAVAAAEITQQK